MAVKTDLSIILKRLDTIDNKLKHLPQIEKDIKGIKGDIKLIKDCVSTENAAKFPPLIKRKPTKATGGAKSGFAMAAAPHK